MNTTGNTGAKTPKKAKKKPAKMAVNRKKGK